MSSSSTIPPKVINRTYPVYPLISTNSNTISNTSNSFTDNQCGLATLGDAGFFNAKLLFSSSLGTPSLTSRSNGTRLVLKPNTTISTSDIAIGTSSSGIWTTSDGDQQFFTYSNLSTPVLQLKNNQVLATSVAIQTNLDTTISPAFQSNGDISVLGSICCSNVNVGSPSLATGSASRSAGTRLVLSQRTSTSIYESAIGCSSSALWLTSQNNFQFYGGTSLLFTLNSSGNHINNSTLSNTSLSNSASNVSQLFSGDIGLSAGKTIYVNPTASTPAALSKSSGDAIILSNQNHIGIDTTGIYQVSPTSCSIYIGTTSLTKTVSFGTATSVLDTTQTRLVAINPCPQDILGCQTTTYNTQPLSATNMNLQFDPTVTSYARVYVHVQLNYTSGSPSVGLYQLDLMLLDATNQYAVQTEEYFDISSSINLTFTSTTTGQIQVQSDNVANFSSLQLKCRAITLPLN